MRRLLTNDHKTDNASFLTFLLSRSSYIILSPLSQQATWATSPPVMVTFLCRFKPLWEPPHQLARPIGGTMRLLEPVPEAQEGLKVNIWWFHCAVDHPWPCMKASFFHLLKNLFVQTKAREASGFWLFLFSCMFFPRSFGSGLKNHKGLALFWIFMRISSLITFTVSPWQMVSRIIIYITVTALPGFRGTEMNF